MPSKSVLETKQAIVAQLKDKVANSVSGVVVDYKGITAEADTKLRKELREAGVEYTVVKNTLLKRAIEGTEIEGMSEVLEGTTSGCFPRGSDRSGKNSEQVCKGFRR